MAATAKGTTKQKSPSNALGSSESLQNFTLLDLQQFTKEGTYSSNASRDFHLFYAGRDDVLALLKYVLSRVSVSIYLNMFGFDDQELNAILMAKAVDSNITMLITLDKSQAGGKVERALIAADKQMNLSTFNTHFVTGQSASAHISHAKGFVADGKVAGVGTTNWSISGEGVFMIGGLDGGLGYKTQNDTQSIITDPDAVSRITAEFIAEHLAAQHAAMRDPRNTSSLRTPAQTR